MYVHSAWWTVPSALQIIVSDKPSLPSTVFRELAFLESFLLVANGGLLITTLS